MKTSISTINHLTREVGERSIGPSAHTLMPDAFSCNRRQVERARSHSPKNRKSEVSIRSPRGREELDDSEEDEEGRSSFTAGAVYLGKKAVRLVDEMGEEVQCLQRVGRHSYFCLGNRGRPTMPRLCVGRAGG